ncbi:MAG: hypothetical protein H6981_08975 [Gammaproteobacteria bacterium]|nr:hypothetical protein [Gammaproteobacteria bacterium]MCP5136921.1 hypothetical protein [Gammaproteobacteria bacterium]
MTDSITQRLIRPLTLLVASGLLLGAAHIKAEESEARWYRVEVVIFENRDLSDARSEMWPANPGLPDLTAAEDLSGPPRGMSVTYSNRLELGGAKQQLARSGRYDPIMHFAWTQRGLDQRHAIPIRIQGGVVFPELPIPSLPEASPLSPMTPTVVGSTPNPGAEATSYAISTTAPVIPKVLHQLDGTLTLVLGRYLHLYTDLIDRRLITPDALHFSNGMPPTYDNGQALASFRVQLHRKMRSKELHYIDHPLLGILVKVLPVAVEPSTEPDAQAAPTT